MLVAVLVGVMISIVVGVNLIPMLMETIEEATEDSEDLPAGASALLDILPIVFVVVVILGAVAWIGGSGLGFSKKSKSKDYHFRGEALSGKDLLEKISREEITSQIEALTPEEEEEEEEEEETEVLETPGTPTYEVPGIPKAPPSKGKSFGKPPWAK